MSDVEPLPQSRDDPSEETSQDAPEVIESPWYAESRVLSVLFDTRGPLWRYVLRAGILSLVPSLVIGFGLTIAVAGNEESLPEFGLEGSPVFLFVLIVVVGPVLETLLLGLGLKLLALVLHRPVTLAFASALVWAALHSTQAWMWGLVVGWPFFVFSCAYLAWRPRSWWHAAGAACGIHAFQNFLPATVLAIEAMTS